MRDREILPTYSLIFSPLRESYHDPVIIHLFYQSIEPDIVEMVTDGGYQVSYQEMLSHDITAGTGQGGLLSSRVMQLPPEPGA